MKRVKKVGMIVVMICLLCTPYFPGCALVFGMQPQQQQSQQQTQQQQQHVMTEQEYQNYLLWVEQYRRQYMQNAPTTQMAWSPYDYWYNEYYNPYASYWYFHGPFGVYPYSVN